MGLSTAVLICVFLSLILLLLYICYRNAMKKVEGFPFAHTLPKLILDKLTGKIPKGVPFTAHVLYTLTDFCQRNYTEGIFMTYFTRPTLFVFSEESMKFFLNEKAAVNKPPEYSLFSDIIGEGLITSNGERYKAHRKLIGPVFHLGMLKDKISLFNKHAMGLVKEIEKMTDKPSVDPLDNLKLNCFYALSESVLGLKQDAKNSATHRRQAFLVDYLTRMVVQRFFYLWLRPRCLLPFSASGRKFIKRSNETKVYIKNVINDMKEHVSSNKIVIDSKSISDENSNHFSNHLRKSLAYVLLNNHIKDPSFTFQDICAEVTTIIAAGYDTVAYTLSWCLFMLGLHPEVQEKAFEEIQATTDGYITYEYNCNLTYLEAVVLETLRLFPTIPVFARYLTEDVQYGKYKVPKDSSVFFISYASHRIPEIYPDPEKFEPERFLGGEGKMAGTFMPFGEGNRICLGKKYAIIEMKIFLAHLLRNFKFTSLQKREDVHPCWNVTLAPSEHIKMKISSRQAENTEHH